MTDDLDRQQIERAAGLLDELIPAGADGRDDLRRLIAGALVDAFAMGFQHGVRYDNDPTARYVNPYR